MRYSAIPLAIAASVSIATFELRYLWSLPNGVEIYLGSYLFRIAILFLISFCFTFMYSGLRWSVLLTLIVAPMVVDGLLIALNIILKKELWFLIVYDWIDEKSFLVAFGILPGWVTGIVARAIWNRTRRRA